MGYVFLILIILVVALVVSYAIAGKFGEAAEGKGYDGDSWRSWCFLTTFIGLNLFLYIAVAALPNRKLQEGQQQTNRLLEENNKLLKEIAANGTAKPQPVLEDMMQDL